MDYRFLAEDDVFPYARVVGVGLSPENLRRDSHAETIFKLHHGWYALRRPRDDVDRHRLRVTALLQEYGEAVVASHASAVVRLDLPTHGLDLGTVHLMWVDPGNTFRSYSRTRIHERLPGDWCAPASRTVDPALAILQVGMQRVSSLLVAGDAALRDATTSIDQLRLVAAVLRGQRGITAARTALDSLDGRHESPGESLTAHLLRSLGYAATPQLVVPREEAPGRYYVADFLIDGTRVLVEFDGREKYQEPVNLFEEKRREDELRRMGYVVVRLTWSDLNRPGEIRRRIDAAIRLSKVARA